ARATALQRFEREAQATAELGSPHTVTVYDFGRTRDGTFYLVMELLDGFDLETLVEQHGALPPERVVHVLTQVCHSLGDAHGRGLIHRDIKPANIYVCRLGPDVDFVKVLDFGLVKHIEPEAGDAPGLTRDGVVTGTPAYMPPEVALGSEPTDERADIYMVGCVAYWLLTGKLVFEGANAVALISNHIHAEPEPPSRRAAVALPGALEGLVMDCLAKDRSQRPPSITELQHRLAQVELDTPWTQERAAEWWAEHHPG
ncbi:MAG: serine/threonine protein kinase, partial [Deltaproteobacteria bacterium]|nr:serine/threonine protein kinase [Deltaproteobacteria bacterium]